MKILATTVLKGGTAKTTTAVTIGAQLVLSEGQRVLLVDLDPQGSLSKWVGAFAPARDDGAGASTTRLLAGDGAQGSGEPLQLRRRSGRQGERGRAGKSLPRGEDLSAFVETKTLGGASLQRSSDQKRTSEKPPHGEKSTSGRSEGISQPTWGVVGADRSLLKWEGVMTASKIAHRLQELFEVVAPRYDYCLLDTPTSAGPLTLAALLCAHGVLAPVQAGSFALDGLAHLLELTRTIGGAPLLGAFACRVDMRTNNDAEVAPLLLEQLGDVREGGRAFPTFVRETVRVREAETACTPLPIYAPDSTAAMDYAAITRTLVRLHQAEPAPA